MKRIYHKVMYRVIERIWDFWHQELRHRWGRRDCLGWTDYKVFHANRPWYHLCCNGNYGGWRTDLCSFLDETWRYHEDQLHKVDDVEDA